jgi:hypothetical protein
MAMSAKVFNGCNQELNIKRLLRHRGSKEYFKDGGWTQDPEEADCFSDIVEVAQACTRHGLNNVEVALRYPASRGDFFSTLIR